MKRRSALLNRRAHPQHPRSPKRLARLALSALMLAALASSHGCGGPDSTTSEDRAANSSAPSIVLISIDTLRSDRLPAYGYDGVDTPALDALARDAVRFDRAFAHYPLTLPSHASMLTGQLPPEHGVRDNAGYALSAEAPYLPRQLRDAGYRTGAFVSAWVLRAETGLGDGFDTYGDRLEAEERLAGVVQRAGADTVAEALDWLEQGGDSDTPFFLFVHLYEPHTPYEAPEAFRGRGRDAYDDEIATADAAVGQLLEDLRRRGDYDPSVIIALSDHGESLGEHGETEHGVLLHRPVLQVPLFVKLPGGERAGEVISHNVGLAQVAPTLRALAGLPGADPEASARGLFEDATGPVYAETFYPRLSLGWSELTALVDGDWHYIHGPRPELYDWVRDPAQLDDRLALDRRRAAAMRERLADFEQPLLPPAAVDEEAAARLASLGYLSAGDAGDGPRPDPKSQLPSLEALRDAVRLQSQGQPAAAEDALRELLRTSPDMPGAWEQLGIVLEELGRPREATEAWKNALRRGGGQATLLALARGLMTLGALDDARDHALLARAAQPVEAGTLLAEIALAGGDEEGGDSVEVARAHLETVLAIRPHDLSAQLVALRVALRQKDLAGASTLAASLGEGLADLPEAPAGWFALRAEVEAGEGRYADAERSFAQAIEQNPAQIEAYLRLTQLLVLQKKHGDAVATINRLLAAHPTRDAYARAAETLEQLRNPTLAAELRRQMQERFPAASE
ncbi:MAG: sulfatase-like hydrolase/transferase [Acidobacteriota bacterium]